MLKNTTVYNDDFDIADYIAMLWLAKKLHCTDLP